MWTLPDLQWGSLKWALKFLLKHITFYKNVKISLIWIFLHILYIFRNLLEMKGKSPCCLLKLITCLDSKCHIRPAPYPYCEILISPWHFVKIDGKTRTVTEWKIIKYLIQKLSKQTIFLLSNQIKHYTIKKRIYFCIWNRSHRQCFSFTLKGKLVWKRSRSSDFFSELLYIYCIWMVLPFVL